MPYLGGDFWDLKDTHEVAAEEGLWEAVQFILVDAPYSVRKEMSVPNSENGVLSLKDMKDFGQLHRDML